MNGEALYKTINMILGSRAYQNFVRRKARKEAEEINRLIRNLRRRVKFREARAAKRNAALNERRKKERRDNGHQRHPSR